MISSRFIPVILTIAAALVLFAMLRLGFWQLDRAAEKQVISDAVAAMSQANIDLSSQAVTVDKRYAQATVEGEYLPQHTFLLDNQVVNGQVGYHVLTPFEMKGSELIVLVNRGWVPVGASRNVKPEISTPQGEMRLSGRFNLPPSKPALWDEEIPIVQDGAWQFLEFSEFSRRTGIEVLPLLIELDKTLDPVGGYVRQWRSYDNHWVSRHQGYAFQWFTMSVVFLILCFFVWRKSKSVKA